MHLGGLSSGAQAGSRTTVSQSGCAAMTFRILRLMWVLRLSQQTIIAACSCWCAAVSRAA